MLGGPGKRKRNGETMSSVNYPLTTNTVPHGNPYYGLGAVTWVVKRVKGRLYVYMQYREGGKVITKYLGPLDRIAEFYFKHVVRGVGFEPTQAYAIGASARPLCPGSGTPALQ